MRMDNKNKGIKIFGNATYLIVGAILLFLCDIMLIGIFIYADGFNENMIVLVIFILMSVALMVLIYVGVGASMLFTDMGIEYKQPFKKKTMKSYDYYPYIYRASYYHGSLIGIGYRPNYIVFSQRRLSSNELKNINQVAISDKVIKIKYSKNVYNKLMHVLPKCKKVELSICFKNIFS